MYGVVAVVTRPVNIGQSCALELVLLSVFRLKKSDLVGKLMPAFCLLRCSSLRTVRGKGVVNVA